MSHLKRGRNIHIVILGSIHDIETIDARVLDDQRQAIRRVTRGPTETAVRDFHNTRTHGLHPTVVVRNTAGGCLRALLGGCLRALLGRDLEDMIDIWTLWTRAQTRAQKMDPLGTATHRATRSIHHISILAVNHTHHSGALRDQRVNWVLRR